MVPKEEISLSAEILSPHLSAEPGTTYTRELGMSSSKAYGEPRAMIDTLVASFSEVISSKARLALITLFTRCNIGPGNDGWIDSRCRYRPTLHKIPKGSPEVQACHQSSEILFRHLCTHSCPQNGKAKHCTNLRAIDKSP